MSIVSEKAVAISRQRALDMVKLQKAAIVTIITEGHRDWRALDQAVALYKDAQDAADVLSGQSAVG